MLLICLTIGLISATVAFTVTLRFNQFLYQKLAKTID